MALVEIQVMQEIEYQHTQQKNFLLGNYSPKNTHCTGRNIANTARTIFSW